MVFIVFQHEDMGDKVVVKVISDQIMQVLPLILVFYFHLDYPLEVVSKV